MDSENSRNDLSVNAAASTCVDTVGTVTRFSSFSVCSRLMSYASRPPPARTSSASCSFVSFMSRFTIGNI